MSIKQHADAMLGKLVPRFPFMTATLNLVNSNLSKSEEDLLEYLGDLDSFVCLTKPTTSDGYFWFRAAKFQLDSGMVTVAFPWKQDWSMLDGTTMDRSIAVYARPEIPDEEISKLLKRIIDAFGYP